MGWPGRGLGLFYYVDVILTHRCNLKCPNCHQFLTSRDVTQLPDGREMDMTVGQIRTAIRQIEVLGNRVKGPVFDHFTLTGGEALLHPDIKEIDELVFHRLAKIGLVAEYQINTNGAVPVLAGIHGKTNKILNIEDRPKVHVTSLCHPDEQQPWIRDEDKPKFRPTYASCAQPWGREYLSLNKHGWHLCCACTGYIELFGLGDLIIDHLPDSRLGFPIEKMNLVCQHCVFGLPFKRHEKDYGRPVSEVYLAEGRLNAGKSRIVKLFPESL